MAFKNSFNEKSSVEPTCSLGADPDEATPLVSTNDRRHLLGGAHSIKEKIRQHYFFFQMQLNSKARGPCVIVPPKMAHCQHSRGKMSFSCGKKYLGQALVDTKLLNG